MAYQVKAGDYQITIASEARESGSVALNQKNGRVNIGVTVNGAGKNFVRGPKNSGTFVVSSDFRKAEANLELQRLLGKDGAKLVAAFLCQ